VGKSFQGKVCKRATGGSGRAHGKPTNVIVKGRKWGEGRNGNQGVVQVCRR